MSASGVTTGKFNNSVCNKMYWAVQKNLVKGCRQTLDCYCVSCELLSASIADALWFVNMVCLPLIAERNAHEICLTQECLQIVRRLLWKQTTTHSLRNNNPMFDGNLWPNSFDQPSSYPNSLRIPQVNYVLSESQNDISHPCTAPQRLSTIPKEANLVPHKGIILGAAPSRRRAYLCKKEWRSLLLSHMSHDWAMTRELCKRLCNFELTNLKW